MKVAKIVFAFVACACIYFFPSLIFSDNIKTAADKYYNRYDYKYAINIYEKLMKRRPSLDVAQKLANCYRYTNNAVEAEKAYARVLKFAGFDPLSYKYYAEALKQNGKYEQAKENYLLYGEKFPALKEEAQKLANTCDVARMWADNPDRNVKILNQRSLNSDYADFSPVKANGTLFFISDRWFVSGNERTKKEVYGWTGNPFLKIYEQDASSSKIKMLSKTINAKYHNGPAVFSSTGDTIYFTRTFVPEGKKKWKKPVVARKTIWYAVKNGEEWSEAKDLELAVGDYSVQHPALSPDGEIIYFACNKPGGFGGMDIYASRKQSNGTWGEPVNCGENINSAEDDLFPYVRTDGKFYFSSKGHISMGGLDVFTSEGSYDKFEMAENLKAPMNSPKDDFGIWFDDDMSGYLSSNRDGGKGLDDIYSFAIVPAVPVYAIEGEVSDKGSDQILANIDIVLYNKTTGREMRTVSDPQGKFRFNLEPGMEYVVSGDKNKYYSRQEGEISTRNLKESTVFSLKFQLEKSENTYLVRLNNIYYDFNKWNIRPDAMPELNRVVSFLNSTADVNIELRSHTDARGSDSYNKLLSQKRAESALSYLHKKGIDRHRLTAVGLGETELLNRCKNKVSCSLDEHQLNRRTEFKVVKVKNSVLAMGETRKK